MDKPWLKNYTEGVPADISIDAYASVADIFDQSVSKFEDLPAYSNFGKTISYREVKELTSRLGAYLKNELALDKGAKVAVMMPNLLQNPVAIFAVLRAGIPAPRPSSLLRISATCSKKSSMKHRSSTSS